MSWLILFTLGAFGSSCMEFLKLREQFGKMRPRKFRLLVRSPLTWLFSGMLVIFSGIFTAIAWNGGEYGHALVVALTGAGFRSFGREGAGALVHNKALTQGEASDPVTIRDILS